MKKIKQIVLFALYMILMISSVRLQFGVMNDPTGIWKYNAFTIVIFLVVGSMILMVYWSLIKQETMKMDSELLEENCEKPADEKVEEAANAAQWEQMTVSQRIERERYQQRIANCGLTKRETEIGYLIVSGYSNAMIAEELFIAETTVKKHVSHIFEKTGTGSRKELKEFVTK